LQEELLTRTEVRCDCVAIFICRTSFHPEWQS